MKEIITALVGAMLLVGCNSTSSKQDEVSSKLQRDLEPKVSEEELSQLVTDNNKFAFSLYQNLNDAQNNTFFSPVSISHALMMTYAGAEGETKEEMKTALGLTLDDTRIHESFNKLDLGLNTNDQTHIFNIANAIWPSRDFEFEQNYLDAIMVNYGASLKTLDYTNSPEESRKTINSWVEEKTEDKIKDLIPEGAITTMTKMVLSNATYFKASWEHPFNTDNTQRGIFNTEQEIDFMNQTEVFPYFEDENVQAIKLDYQGSKSAMIILLPKVDTFTPSTFNIQESFERYRVSLKMPKFKFTSDSISLTDTMKTLGMKLAFDSDRADFSNLSQKGSIYISNIMHKAFIEVDEHGTEAAAATAVLLSTTGIEIVPNAQMSIDKPFVYMIVDNETGQILFLGHMLKP
jgi:serpin B